MIPANLFSGKCSLSLGVLGLAHYNKSQLRRATMAAVVDRTLAFLATTIRSHSGASLPHPVCFMLYATVLACSVSPGSFPRYAAGDDAA
jgi:hypothetical protein